MCRPLLAIAILLGSVASARGDTCRPLPKTKRVHVELRFLDVQSLVDAWAAFTCQDFVVPPALGRRAITMETRGSLTVREFEERARAALRAVGIDLAPTRAVKLVLSAGEATPTETDATAQNPFRADDADGITDSDFEAGIKCERAGHCTVVRAFWERLLSNTAYLASGARFVPHIREGKPHGFKLYAIRPGSFYARVGLQNHDVIVAVNGISISTPDRALEAYTSLRGKDHLLVDLERRDAAATIEIFVR